MLHFYVVNLGCKALAYFSKSSDRPLCDRITVEYFPIHRSLRRQILCLLPRHNTEIQKLYKIINVLPNSCALVLVRTLSYLPTLYMHHIIRGYHNSGASDILYGTLITDEFLSFNLFSFYLFFHNGKCCNVACVGRVLVYTLQDK